jgi:hypothetical protein
MGIIVYSGEPSSQIRTHERWPKSIRWTQQFHLYLLTTTAPSPLLRIPYRSWPEAPFWISCKRLSQVVAHSLPEKAVDTVPRPTFLIPRQEQLLSYQLRSDLPTRPFRPCRTLDMIQANGQYLISTAPVRCKLQRIPPCYSSW